MQISIYLFCKSLFIEGGKRLKNKKKNPNK